MTKILASLWLLIAVGAHGQGTFVNLNFEQATIIPIPDAIYYPYEVAGSNALPGWTIYNSFLGNRMLYNTYSLGSPLVSIHDGTAPTSIVPLQGKYSVFLQPLVNGTVHTAIGQVGTIPTIIRSLRFWSSPYPLDVSFAGNSLSLVPLQTTPNYTLYGADISMFAGQTGELLFREMNPAFTYGTLLDNISFSPISVPEPSTGVLALALAAIMALARPRRRRSR